MSDLHYNSVTIYSICWYILNCDLQMYAYYVTIMIAWKDSMTHVSSGTLNSCLFTHSLSHYSSNVTYISVPFTVIRWLLRKSNGALILLSFTGDVCCCDLQFSV